MSAAAQPARHLPLAPHPSRTHGDRSHGDHPRLRAGHRSLHLPAPRRGAEQVGRVRKDHHRLPARLGPRVLPRPALHLEIPSPGASTRHAGSRTASWAAPCSSPWRASSSRCRSSAAGTWSSPSRCSSGRCRTTVVLAEFARRRRAGRMCRPVVLVGTNAEGNAIQELFHSQPQLGYYVVARVRGADVDVSEDPSRPDTRVIDRTLHLVEAEGASGVVIASSAMNMATSTYLIRELTESGVHVELSSTLLDISSNRITVRPHGRLPVFYIEPVSGRVARASEAHVRRRALGEPHPDHRTGRGDRRHHREVDIDGPRVLPADPHRPRRPAVQDLQGADDGERRRGPARGPPQPQRDRRPAVQDQRRPADHHGRARAPQALDRRASAALERPARRDEHRRAPPRPPQRGRRMVADMRSSGSAVKPGITGMWQVNGRTARPSRSTCDSTSTTSTTGRCEPTSRSWRRPSLP